MTSFESQRISGIGLAVKCVIDRLMGGQVIRSVDDTFLASPTNAPGGDA